MSAEPIGRWKRPPCALCGAVIEASVAKPPMFVLEAGVWVHWGCWRKAKGIRVEIDRLGDRGWKSVGDVLQEIQSEWGQYRHPDV